MYRYNVIVVFSADRNRLLMCKRRKEPYLGLFNMVGGKIEPGEDHLSAAYRELEEETGIPRDAISLAHLMDFTYYFEDGLVEVYVGRLTRDVDISGDENDLLWMDADQNFFDSARFAGGGNIGHIMNQIRLHARKIFDAFQE